MADSNLLKRSLQNRFDDGDPFAELSRIIGREAQPEAPSIADDPFDIDLEKELMGDLDEAVHEDVDAARAVHPGAPRFEPAEDLASATGGLSADDAFAAEFDDVDWDSVEEPEAEAVAEEAMGAYAPAQPAEAWQTPQPGHDEPAGTDDDGGFADDAGFADVDMDFGDLDAVGQPAPEPQAPDHAVAQYVTETQDNALYAAAGDADHALVEAEDYAVTEAEDYAGDYAAAGYSAYEEIDRPAVEVPGEDPYAGMPATAAAEPSLEDELSLLLNGGAPERPAGYHDAGADELHEASAQAPAAPVTSTIFGRANHAVAGHASHPHEQPDEIAGESDDAWLDAAGEFEALAEPAAEQPSDPFAVFANIATAMPAFHAPQGGGFAAPGAETMAPAESPYEIETVEVAASHVPMQDDLDLPETPFEETPPAAYDDFEADLATSFGAPDALPPQPAAGAADDAYGDEQFAEAIGLSGAAAAASGAGWRARPQDDSGAGLERDIDVGSYEATEAAAAPRRRNGLVVAAAVAAIALLGGVGALALSFGGGDADDTPALVKADAEPLKVKPENPGGTSIPNQDSKAYERASGVVDTSPPAQEKLVTSTEEPVTLGVNEAAEDSTLPGLDEEIAAADEAPAAKSEDRLEAAAEPDGVGAVQDLATVQPRKVRTMVVRPDGSLVPREEVVAPAAPAADQIAAVPTLAPPEAAGSQAVREVAIARQPQTQDSGAANGTQSQRPAAAQAAASAERAVEVPATGPAVPQRPAAEPRANTPAPAQEQVAQAVAPARAQPAVPAAPAGASEWSMQIASQPTAEAAQASYQDLARRYSGVLAGRGVNIVKADISGKGTYYRVRIPSATRDEAIALCEKYKAAGGSCFVSK